MEHHFTEKLLVALKPKYPTTWPQVVSMHEWQRELEPYNNLQVKYAIDQLRHQFPRFPPNAMEFANLCDEYAERRSQQLTRCTAPGCPLEISGERCSFHFSGMGHHECEKVSECIRRNIELVNYYVFLQSVRLVEIPAPQLWDWPAYALDQLKLYPIAESELPGVYVKRIGATALQACGIDAKYLDHPAKRKKDKSYKQSPKTFKSMTGVMGSTLSQDHM